MDGIEFFKIARSVRPDSVRIMLTGFADVKATLAALNECTIFRFLTKPCTVDQLSAIVAEGVKQYKSITGQKQLLSQTLAGSVGILTDIVSMVDRSSFDKALDARPLIRDLCRILDVDCSTDIELAAMLYEIGKVTLPPELNVKLKSGVKLSVDELDVVQRVPMISRKLLSKLPKLSDASELIYSLKKSRVEALNGQTATAPFGAKILQLVRDLKKLESAGKSAQEAGAIIEERSKEYDPAVLKAFLVLKNSVPKENYSGIECSPGEVFSGQLVLRDIVTKNGQLLVARGHVLSPSSVDRIKSHARLGELTSSILVESSAAPVEVHPVI